MTPPETYGDVFYVLVSARVLVRWSCQVRTRIPFQEGDFLFVSPSSSPSLCLSFLKGGSSYPSGLVATRQSSLILIGRPFRSRNKHSSALFFRSFRWQIPWRRREMPPALSVPSLSEWSTPVCSFLIKAWYVFWASLRVTWTVPMKWNPSVLSSTS